MVRFCGLKIREYDSDRDHDTVWVQLAADSGWDLPIAEDYGRAVEFQETSAAGADQ